MYWCNQIDVNNPLKEKGFSGSLSSVSSIIHTHTHTHTHTVSSLKVMVELLLLPTRDTTVSLATTTMSWPGASLMTKTLATHLLQRAAWAHHLGLMDLQSALTNTLQYYLGWMAPIPTKSLAVTVRLLVVFGNCDSLSYPQSGLSTKPLLEGDRLGEKSHSNSSQDDDYGMPNVTKTSNAKLQVQMKLLTQFQQFQLSFKGTKVTSFKKVKDHYNSVSGVQRSQVSKGQGSHQHKVSKIQRLWISKVKRH